MIYLSKKVKIIIAILIIATVTVVVQFIYTPKEIPQVFVDLQPTIEAQEANDAPKEVVKVEEVVVDIKGEVVNPGVYHLQVNDRIQDALESAGGPTENADVNQVNLAMKIYDEMVIFIPSKGEDLNQKLIAINDGKISINQGNEADLMTLPGIGEAKAKEIVEYRNKNGYFNTIEDIMKVSGIGPKTFENLKNKITVH